MKCQFDSLKCAKILKDGGVAPDDAEAIAGMLTETNINNLYSRPEIDEMLNEVVKTTLAESRREFDQLNDTVKTTLAENRRQFDKSLERSREDLAEVRRQFDQSFARSREDSESNRRWIVGTIITCALALGGYLSALMHLTH